MELVSTKPQSSARVSFFSQQKQRPSDSGICDDAEKQLAGRLTLGASTPTHSNKNNNQRRRPKMINSLRKGCGQQQQQHSTSNTSSSSRSSTSSKRAFTALPHSITERHGGRELWVKAPVLTGELEKEGFRWRKKWKTRLVELNGRVLSYYELESTSRRRGQRSQRHAEPRRQVHLTADAVLEDLDTLTFAITPTADEKPWVFRTKDPKTKLTWCKALSDCIDILVWLQHYTVGDVLGVGGNGVVKQLVDQRNGERFAVKVIDVSKFKDRDAVVAEVEIMRNITNNIKHPNLVKIHKVYEEQEKIYIILELCAGGELYDSIVQRGRYSEADAARIMKQLISALQALHQHNILHLDIKPENILFASNEKDAKILLTDFGLARMVNGKQNPLERGKSMAGTVGYIAPEVITSHMYSEAADVFSAGVILFILLVGYPPFFGDTEVEILLKIARGDFQFHAEDWGHISQPAKELVSKMLAVRAQERITVDEILKHPWIVQANADRELSQTMERLQQFNFARKSVNMGTFVGHMLMDVNEEEYSALVDIKTIEMMIRQVCSRGTDRIPLTNAHLLSRGFGLSPYVDEEAFVNFMDVNKDGYIDAHDFCEGVKALRSCDPAFAKIVFAALVKIFGKPSEVLTREHFEVAFKKLDCPEPLVKYFFKSINDHQTKNSTFEQEETKWQVNETEFVELMQQYPFVGRLFLQSAKDTVIAMVKSRSIDDLPRISEDDMRDSCDTCPLFS